jgi:hypothetical protein
MIGLWIERKSEVEYYAKRGEMRVPKALSRIECL